MIPGRKLSLDEFVERSVKIHKNKYNYDKVIYVNQYTDIIIFCNDCEQYFYQKPKSHMNGRGCSVCGLKKQIESSTYTTLEFVKKAKDVHGNLYGYENVEYIKSHIKINIFCKKCNIYFSQRPTCHLLGQGCPKCRYVSSAKSNRKNRESFIQKAKEVHGGIYKYDSIKYKDRKTNVDIFCTLCESYFSQTPKVHLRGHGCNICNISRGERDIILFLNNNNVAYIREWTEHNCKNEATLRFDFYLPNFNTLIEYDGLQHYKPIKQFGGMKEFEKTQKRDKIKNEWAIENNYTMIRIPYYEDVNEVLSKALL